MLNDDMVRIELPLVMPEDVVRRPRVGRCLRRRVPQNLTGQRFGRLFVIGTSMHGEDGRLVAPCICDCGWSGRIRVESMKSGNTKSCGCLRRKVELNDVHA